MTSGFNGALDAFALAYAIVFFPASIFWLIIHPAINFWRRFGNRAYWVALPLWLVSGTVLVLLRRSLFVERMSRTALTWTLGFVLVGLAVWLDRLVLRQFSLPRLLGFPEISPRKYAGGMVRSGVYAEVRHPRYLEYMLTFVGLALLTGARGIFVLAIVSVLLYLIVAPLEERELREHYGADYEAYAREVPRFIPRLRRRTKPQLSS